jgi:hypothetical protein
MPMLRLLGSLIFPFSLFVRISCSLATQEFPQKAPECAGIFAGFSGNPAENPADFLHSRTRTCCPHAGICRNFCPGDPGIQQAGYPPECLREGRSEGIGMVNEFRVVVVPGDAVVIRGLSYSSGVCWKTTLALVEKLEDIAASANSKIPPGA